MLAIPVIIESADFHSIVTPARFKPESCLYRDSG